jgi:hypothetical protein
LFIGAGIITDGSDPNLLKRQSYNLKVARGKKVVRYISVQNKGTVSDTVQILGVTTISSNATPAHFKVKYFLGAKTPPNLSTDLTSAIEGVGASSYSTASLAPDAITGDATWIRVEISVDKTAPHKSSCEVLVKGLSDGNSAKSDVVKITVTVP